MSHVVKLCLQSPWCLLAPTRHQPYSLLPGHHRHPQVPSDHLHGGPGCSKGTQCKNTATKYGFCHMGLGQLLGQEAQQGTGWGQKIRDIMLQGLLVPMVRAHGHEAVGGWIGGVRGIELKVVHRVERRMSFGWKPIGSSVHCHCLLLYCPEPLCPQL